MAGLNYKLRIGRDDMNAGQDVPTPPSSPASGDELLNVDPPSPIDSSLLVLEASLFWALPHPLTSDAASAAAIAAARMAFRRIIRFLSASGPNESLKMREMVRGLMYLREPRAGTDFLVSPHPSAPCAAPERAFRNSR